MNEKPTDTKWQDINLVCFPHGVMHEPKEKALQKKPSLLHLGAIIALISAASLLAIINFGTFCILLLATYWLALMAKSTQPAFKKISKILALQANENELLFKLDEKKSMRLKWSNLVEIKLTGEPIFAAMQPTQKNGSSYDLAYSFLTLNYSQEPHLVNHPDYQIEELKLEDHPQTGNQYKFIKFAGKSIEETYYIPLYSIPDQETWKELSTKIKAIAPHVEIDGEITSAFKIPSLDTSFTEIWLNGITKAPEVGSLLCLPTKEKLSQGKYEITKQLASGGQGRAYLAREVTSGNEVVIKEYLLPVYQNKQVKDNAAKELEAEASLLQRLDYPQIVRFLDWFIEADRAFLVLNHVEGLTLKAWIKQNGLPTPALVRNLALQMCEILNHLHNCDPPIIHRDFTPDNLIINKENQLTLIDFTIAEPTGVSSNQAPAGKPAYMPPEQFRGETSIQSDLYALGGTLYFLITGHDPVALEQPADMSVDTIIGQIIYKCRAQLSEDRYRNAREIMTLLSPAA